MSEHELTLRNQERSREMKVHVGCGSKFIPGFYHIDISPAPHIDRVALVDNLNFLSDGSVDLLYASHVLEHFGRNEYRSVLAEWHRVLRPGGILRLAVPDFQVAARLYLAGALSRGLEEILGLICGGQRNSYDFHKMVFDENLLTRALLETGFSQVRRWNWRETEHATIDDYSQAYLPHMQKDTGTLVSLNLEGIK